MTTKRIGAAVETDEVLPIRAVMTMPPDWVVGAFTAAVERVRLAAEADRATSRGIGIPLAEALMWLDVLQQTSRDVGRGRDVAAELARDPLLNALKFARNLVHHHWGSATTPSHIGPRIRRGEHAREKPPATAASLAVLA